MPILGTSQPLYWIFLSSFMLGRSHTSSSSFAASHDAPHTQMLACMCCCLPYVLLLAWLSTNPLQVVSPPEVSFQKDCSPAEVRTRLLIVVCAPCVCWGGGGGQRECILGWGGGLKKSRPTGKTKKCACGGSGACGTYQRQWQGCSAAHGPHAFTIPGGYTIAGCR